MLLYFQLFYFLVSKFLSPLSVLSHIVHIMSTILYLKFFDTISTTTSIPKVYAIKQTFL
jgi:hypothetical protein